MRKTYDVPSSNGKEHYSVWIEFDELEEPTDKWSCTCQFGSNWRFSEKHIQKKTKCKHASEIYDCLRIIRQKAKRLRAEIDKHNQSVSKGGLD